MPEIIITLKLVRKPILLRSHQMEIKGVSVLSVDLLEMGANSSDTRCGWG